MERCVCVPACVRIGVWTVFIHVCIAVLAAANRTCIQNTFKQFCFGLDSRWAWNGRDSLIVTDRNSLWEFPIPWNETKSFVCLSHHVVILCHIVHKTLLKLQAETYWEIHGRTARCKSCSMYRRSIASLRKPEVRVMVCQPFRLGATVQCVEIPWSCNVPTFVLEHLWQEGIWHTVKIRRNPAPPNM